MKRAVIVINAYSQLRHALYQAHRLREELIKLGASADIVRNHIAAAYLDERGGMHSALTQYDFCVYLDKDKYLSRLLEQGGMRLFNRHDAVEACDDKMTTYIRLAGCGIPMPVTVPAPLCYDADAQPDRAALERLADMLGFPVVVKTSYGSLGQGVFKADDLAQLQTIAARVKGVPHLFQQFAANSCGRDLRVVVIGGKYVAAMERHSRGDFRSNLELGGTGTAVTPPDEVIDMCERAAGRLQLDYCGVDVLFGTHGYLLCEVNSNAFFRGAEAATGINIAEAYCRYMLSQV